MTLPLCTIISVAAFILCSYFGQAWDQLSNKSHCFNDNILNCSSSMPTRQGHSTVENGTHLFVFGGRRNRLVNTSINQDIGVDPPVVIDVPVVPATILPGWSHCNQLSNCWGRGICQNSTCACFSGFFGQDCSLEEDMEIFEDLWLYDIVNEYWMQIPSSSKQPWARTKHSAVLYNERMVLYGGYSLFCTDYCSDVWEFRTAGGMSPDGHGGYSYFPQGWRPIGNGPGKRWRHTATLWGHRMVVYGGHHIFTSLSDVWIMDLETYTWTEHETFAAVVLEKPFHRLGHSASVFKDRLYIYGGYHASVNRTERREPSLSDFWYLDLITFKWHKIHETRHPQSPGPRTDISSAVADNYLYIFGGYFDNQFRNDTWQFNLTSSAWRVLPIPGRSFLPHRRALHTLSFVHELNMLIIVGGHGSDSEGVYTEGVDHYGDVWKISFDECKGGKVGTPEECSGRGKCEFGTCRCIGPWFDDDCTMNICPGDECTYVNRTPTCVHCHGRGKCNDGVCTCGKYYAGAMCHLQNCDNNNCSFGQRGTCIDRFPTDNPICECYPDYYAYGCTQVNCPRNCSGHGFCNPVGQCLCDSRVYSGFVYNGFDCSDYVREEELLSKAILRNPNYIGVLILSIGALWYTWLGIQRH